MSDVTTTPIFTSSLVSTWEWATRLLGAFPQDILLLIARVSVASVFLKSGLTKIESWDVAVQLFEQEYMVPLLPPELAATIAATFELGASTLIILGLFTRLATLPLLGMTFVIEVFVYPDAWVDHLMWATLLLFILTRGPGLFSLDTMVRRVFIGR